MDPIVSIICNTYNQEAYIEKTLKGFLSQKTSYSFEILVCDDASTDDTPLILREYEKKYPSIIHCYYHEENLYSKGINTFYPLVEKACGKYIAVCEGDDYWIDTNKLEEQVKYMEAHDDCSFCFTNAYLQYGEKIKRLQVPWDRTVTYDKNKEDYTIGELANLGFIPTASFLYRNGYPYPEMPDRAYRGDLYLKLSMAYYGYAHFINKPMVVYRRAVENSLTAQWANNDKLHISQLKAMIVTYKTFDKMSDSRYKKEFDLAVAKLRFTICFYNKDAKMMRRLVKSGGFKKLKAGNIYCKGSYMIKTVLCLIKG